jgi:hypothetical protein
MNESGDVESGADLAVEEALDALRVVHGREAELGGQHDEGVEGLLGQQQQRRGLQLLRHAL